MVPYDTFDFCQILDEYLGVIPNHFSGGFYQFGGSSSFGMTFP